jgi:hypothetical protein
MKFDSLYQFTDGGLTLFEQAFNGQIGETVINLDDAAVARPIAGTIAFTVAPFETAHELAAAVLNSLGTHMLPELLPNTGLWAWLTFVLRDIVFPVGKDGKRSLGEIHRWYPSQPNDYQKAQRHLVRMPVTLLATLGPSADHLLCGKPSVHGDVREQLTSQQEMFHPSFQGAARALYFDEAKNKLKPGAGGKGAGSPRRLARVRRQFDVTWDLFALSADQLVEMLPKEFDRFRPQRTERGAVSSEAASAQAELRG